MTTVPRPDAPELPALPLRKLHALPAAPAIPASGTRVPKYRHHKPSGQAVVTLSGKDHYLGTWDSPESRRRYDQLLAEWMAGGRVAPPTAKAADPVTVEELIAHFLAHAERYYQGTNWVNQTIKPSLIPLRRLYGTSAVTEFGPRALKAVREHMIRTPTTRKLKDGTTKVSPPLCRTEINRRIGIIKRAFKWGVENEMVPSAAFQALDVVEGMRRGHYDVRERDPIGPVSEEDFHKALPKMPPPVRAMCELMWFAGMRPGEVVQMRGQDIDTSKPTWVYRPAQHKNAHRGLTRDVAIGPRGQEAVRPFLRPDDPGAFLFSPRAWVTSLRQSLTTTGAGARKRKPQPKRKARDCYDTSSLGYAVRRACLKAGVPPFGVNRIRHAFATRMRGLLGSLEQVRALLGHSDTATTLIYAERDQSVAMEIMAKHG